MMIAVDGVVLATVRPRPSREIVMADDPVNHPAHYTSGKIEVIDFIEDQGFGFHLGQVVKYVSRAGKKDNEIQDLQKAQWYLTRYIAKKLNA
jgi:hypothetical protein